MICRGAIVVLNLGHGRKGMGEKKKKMKCRFLFVNRLITVLATVQYSAWASVDTTYCTYRVPFLKMLRIQEHFCSLHEYR